MKRNDGLIDNNNAIVYEYLDGIDMDSLSISCCERFDEKSRVWNFERHKHDYLEFIYYLSGKAPINVPGEIENLPISDLVVYPPQVMHQEFLDRSVQQEMICIGVDASSMHQVDALFELSDNSRKLRWLFLQICDEYEKREENHETLIKAYLISVFLLIKRHFKSIEKTAEDIVSRCMRYIHEHFSENITMEKLAATAYVSQSYLTRLFKSDLGISPIRYIIGYRIETAKQLLLTSEASITEVAEFTGFSDQKYFSRVFRKYTGVSPRDYRKGFGSSETRNFENKL